ncbi:MAG: hypothetical protein Q8P34_20520 [Bacteroidota bacterium]|nr:hypothetical protein [Bacteroidota bacterium]
MNKQKLIYRSAGLQVLLLTALLFMNSQKATAQKDPTENKLSKYELSIDLVPIIDEGRFGKIYFKIKKFDGEQEKGAFRLGVSKGTYMLWNNDESTNPEGVTTSYDKHSHFETGLFLGYEKYKKIGPVLTYYGLDIKGWHFKDHHTPQNYTDDQGIITMGICPFWGIKHYLLKNRVSTSFEIGWENSFSKNKNQYDGMTTYFTLSELQLPYNFTINYHF